MSARRSCNGPTNGAAPGWCLSQLAAGDIGQPDMCGPCSHSYMAALEWVTGESLPWSEQIRRRAVWTVGRRNRRRGRAS